MRLAGKTAIVTGGASGFGEGIVRKFVAEGASVVIMDRDAERSKALGIRGQVIQHRFEPGTERCGGGTS